MRLVNKDKAMHDGATRLHIAAAQRHWEVARLLLEANADKDKAMHDGATPLYIATVRRLLACCRSPTWTISMPESKLSM